MTPRVWLCLALAAPAPLAFAACTRAPPGPAVPATRGEALRALARCTFDEALAHHESDAAAFARDASRVESALRTSIRADRNAHALRADRCASALPAELRAREPALAELYRAWGELGALAQAARPEDIALERAIRHVGNAWRASAR